jgi:hypothetical protein
VQYASTGVSRARSATIVRHLELGRDAARCIPTKLSLRKLLISDATSVLSLQQEIQRSQESRYDHRLHGVLIAQGMTCPEVARLLGDAPRSVQNWVHRLDQRGLGERSGRPSNWVCANANGYSGSSSSVSASPSPF